MITIGQRVCVSNIQPGFERWRGECGVVVEQSAIGPTVLMDGEQDPNAFGGRFFPNSWLTVIDDKPDNKPLPLPG